VTLPEIIIPDKLRHLIDDCEKGCVKACCGIDAYDFTPLHIASSMSAYTGTINPADVEEMINEVKKFDQSFDELQLAPIGFVCSIEHMNQHFNLEGFKALINELTLAIEASPKILELSDQFAPEVQCWKVIKDTIHEEINQNKMQNKSQ
jgi:hypothetical protein